MKKYYIENGKIVINRYIVKYEDIINNIDSEIKSSVVKYISNQGEFNSLINELEMKGINYNTEAINTDDIIQYNGVKVNSEEEARKLIEPTIEELINNKIEEVSNICKTNIFSGIDIILSNNETKHFSFKTEDQINISDLYTQVINGLLNEETGVPYHADGEICKLYSIEDFINISNSLMIFKLQEYTYCNHLMQYIKSLTNKNDIMSVSYGQELTGEYLDNYNNSLKVIIDKYNQNK